MWRALNWELYCLVECDVDFIQVYQIWTLDHQVEFPKDSAPAIGGTLDKGCATGEKVVYGGRAAEKRGGLGARGLYTEQPLPGVRFGNE